MRTTDENSGRTTPECPAGFILLARLTIDLNSLSPGNRPLPKRRTFRQRAIRRLGLFAIVLLILAAPAGVLFTLNYVGGQITRKALEVQADFRGSPVP